MPLDAQLRTRLLDDVATVAGAGIDIAPLHGLMPVRRTSDGPHAQLHRYGNACAVTSTPLRGEPTKASWIDAISDPRGCTCLASPTGSPMFLRRALDLLGTESVIAHIAADPAPHQWQYWCMVLDGIHDASVYATRWPELGDRLRTVTRPAADPLSERVAQWRADFDSPAAVRHWQLRLAERYAKANGEARATRDARRALLGGGDPGDLHRDTRAALDAQIDAALGELDDTPGRVTYALVAPYYGDHWKRVLCAQYAIAASRPTDDDQRGGWYQIVRVPAQVAAICSRLASGHPQLTFAVLPSGEPVTGDSAALCLELWDHDPDHLDDAWVTAAIATN